MQLTHQSHLPEQYHEPAHRLHHFVEKHAGRLLSEHYWTDQHLHDIQSHTGHSYVYIRCDDYDAFADTNEYLYNRFKRCIYQRVASILNSHTDEYNAFKFVVDTVEERKIRGIGWERLRNELYDSEEYIEWGIIETVVKQLNNYYDEHGRFPSEYTSLVSTPEPNGTLPYAPDDYDIHELDMSDNKVVFTMNAPDSLSPDSHHDWSNHTIEFPVSGRLAKMLKQGDTGAPTLHKSEHGYTLDLPVEIDEVESETVEDRVLAVDLGVKKQATATIVEAGDEDDEHEQIVQPIFLDHPDKQKLFRLKNDAEGINDKLSELRGQGKDHTDQFDQLLEECRLTRRKERRLREQIQHDLSNELVWLALQYGCETIVFESLGQLNNSGASARTAWSISSWARGTLLDHVEYKSDLVGLDVATVNPWRTSRYCPRCGKYGKTLVAPNLREECRHGGHFYCPHCGHECDRDIVGSLNVARVYFEGGRLEEANPVTYTEAGNHASFPSLVPEVSTSARSIGVQSAAQTGSARSRQTPSSQNCSSPLYSCCRSAKWCGTTFGGLSKNHGSNTGLQWPRCGDKTDVEVGSVVRHVLARAAEDATRKTTEHY